MNVIVLSGRMESGLTRYCPDSKQRLWENHFRRPMSMPFTRRISNEHYGR